MSYMQYESTIYNMHDILFFFSSRRRHTRWPRDWSSDVCSSDLPALYQRVNVEGTVKLLESARLHAVKRSEERRVGKECRFLGIPELYLKNKISTTPWT